jgi:ribosomal protein L19
VNPRTGRPWSTPTLRRRARPDDESHVSSAQFAATRHPYGVPVKIRQPISERLPSGEYLLRQLRHEEKDRVLKLFPRDVCEFKTGDRVAVHKAISLYNPKTQVYRGLVIDKRRGPHASFTLRCVKEETMFEIQLPLFSPFIRKIEMQAPGTSRRNKIYETRNMSAIARLLFLALLPSHRFWLQGRGGHQESEPQPAE